LTATYRVVFRPKAQKQFERLAAALRQQLARKLVERSANPRVPGDALHGMKDCYKIKLRSAGVRLIYKVEDQQIILLVLAVAGREGEEAYKLAARELRNLDD
jgi:mRNA interferase RelE/StbE